LKFKSFFFLDGCGELLSFLNARQGRARAAFDGPIWQDYMAAEVLPLVLKRHPTLSTP
jgi:hypothetical protein